MDLRHDQLPWNEQIWAKINADLAHALSLSRRVRAPFEVFHVPPETQVVMADRIDDGGDYKYSETSSLPVIQISVEFKLRESQVFNEGRNFFSLDRIIQAAHELGFAEDLLILRPNAKDTRTELTERKTKFTLVPEYWDGLFYPQDPDDDTATLPLELDPIVESPPKDEIGFRMFDYVIAARARLRKAKRYDPYALILSSDLEGEISSTSKKGSSLSTPIERMKPLVTGGIHSSPAMPERTALVVSCSRAWIDIAQAMEPSVQFLRIDEDGNYILRLIERFTFRMKDREARIAIRIKTALK